MALYIQIGCLCVFTGQPASRQCGCQYHHSLPRIDPPTALLLSALSCRIDVLSNDFHTHYAQIFVLSSAHMHRHFENSVHTRHSALTSSYSIQRLLQDPHSATRSVTLLIFPSWVVSRCLGQINQPKLTSGSREKDRKGGIYGAGAINRRKGPSAALI